MEYNYRKTTYDLFTEATPERYCDTIRSISPTVGLDRIRAFLRQNISQPDLLFSTKISKLHFNIYLRDNITKHLIEFNLVKSCQHGFVKKRPCLTHLLEFLECVCGYIDKGLPVDVIYLDFRKAFDKVPYKRLMVKVNVHGIRGNIWGWIDNWLSGRRLRVALNGRESNWIDVLSVEDSVSGPVLFVIYINGIDSYVISRILKLADDTKIVGVVSSPDGVMLLRQDLIDLYRRSNYWLMLFNTEKCKVMNLGNNNPCVKYDLGGWN